MAKLFEKQRTNCYYNWLRFIEDLLKSLLVCFLMGHSVYCKYIDAYMHQSINQNLYSAPARFLLRGAPDPGQAEKNSVEKVVELKCILHKSMHTDIYINLHMYEPTIMHMLHVIAYIDLSCACSQL